MQIFHVYIKINIQRVWKDGIHLVCGWTERERERLVRRSYGKMMDLTSTSIGKC